MAESDPIDTRDVVQSSKTDVKDSANETHILPTEDSSPQGDSQLQALPEPLIQDALPLTYGGNQEQKNSDRLEDVFQDEIVKAFVKMADFKTFARSRRGLCLDEIDIGNIVADNQHSIQEQKIQLLNKWREKKGRAATAFNIRSLVKKFNNPDSEKDYVELSSEYIIYKDEPLCKESNVYCGEQRSEVTVPRKVAIKLTPLNVRNKREAEHLIKLSNHPNVLTYIHSGIHDGEFSKQIYLVTELCRRENLGMLMEANKKLGIHFSESQKKSIAVQFLGGMKYIHSHGIIHRDIKPSNVLFSINGILLKISDYGLSKSLQHGQSVTELSISRVGTDGFRAPETYLDNVISQKSDVFSSGLLLYYTVSDGEHAFGEDPDRWNSNIKDGKNLDISQIHVTEKDQTKKILMKMLQFDRKKRPTIKDIMDHDVFQHSSTDLQIDYIQYPTSLTQTVPTGGSPSQKHSQLQALPEPLIQDALPGADGEEQETEALEPPSNWTRGRELGRGAFGTVYLAYDEDTERKLAVKQVHVQADDTGTSMLIEALRKEIDLLRRSSHERIVQYYGSCEDSNTLSVFMEYMEEGSIKDEIALNGALTEQVACKYTRQIIEGLSYLHTNNILHRDIKGSNILRDVSGNIKLGDFGSAKLGQNMLTTLGTTSKGTLYWMSPEVIKGEAYGRKADTWSLGCTVVEMLTTHPPWHELEPMDALFKIYTGPTKTELPPTVSQDCRDFIIAIFVDKDKRPYIDEISKHNWLKIKSLP